MASNSATSDHETPPASPPVLKLNRGQILPRAEATAVVAIIFAVIAFAVLIRPVNKRYALGMPLNIEHTQPTEEELREAVEAEPEDPWIAYSAWRAAEPGAFREELRIQAFRLFHTPSIQRFSLTTAQRDALHSLALDFAEHSDDAITNWSWKRYAADFKPWEHRDIPSTPVHSEFISDLHGLNTSLSIQDFVDGLSKPGALRIDKPSPENNPNGISDNYQTTWGQDNRIAITIPESDNEALLVLHGGAGADIGSLVEVRYDDVSMVIYARDDRVLTLAVPPGTTHIKIRVLNPGGSSKYKLPAEEGDRWTSHTRVAHFAGVWELHTQ